MQGKEQSLRQPIYNTTSGFLQGPCPKGPILTVWHQRSGRTGFRIYRDGQWHDSFRQQALDRLFGISPRRKKTGSQSGYPSEPVIRAAWRYLKERYNEGDPDVTYSKVQPNLTPSAILISPKREPSDDKLRSASVLDKIQFTPIARDIGEPSQPDRIKQETYRILRDTVLAREVKTTNQYRCQICGQTLMLKAGEPYAEAHHIKPLGTPHNGPDVRENILCVCPNHHILLDYGAIKLDKAQLKGIDREYIDYHNEHIFG